MGYTVKATANHFLDIGRTCKEEISPLKVYGDLSGTQLSGMDHAPETQWDIECNYQPVMGDQWRRARRGDVPEASQVIGGPGLGGAASGAVAHVHDLGLGLLSTELTRDLDAYLAKLVKGAPTLIDKAMDAKYNATRLGGGLHRLFDGGHTLLGACQAAKKADIDGGIVARAMGVMLGLSRDVTTPAGLPFFTWDKDTYDRASSYLKNTFGIPKKVFSDLNTYRATDIISSLMSSATLLFRWSDGEAEDFARIATTTGLSAIAKRNPIVAVVTIAALAKALVEARDAAGYKGCVKECVKGVAPMAVVSLVVAAGGPASVALITNILAGIAVEHVASKAGGEARVARLLRQIRIRTPLPHRPWRRRGATDPGARHDFSVQPSVKQGTAADPTSPTNTSSANL